MFNLTDVNGKNLSHWPIFSEKISEINIETFDFYLTDCLTEQRKLLICLTPVWLVPCWAIHFCFHSILTMEFSPLPRFQVPESSFFLLRCCLHGEGDLGEIYTHLQNGRATSKYSVFRPYFPPPPPSQCCNTTQMLSNHECQHNRVLSCKQHWYGGEGGPKCRFLQGGSTIL